MIRMATLADIPQMLEIYTPYVENTTFSFEYAPPTQAQFTQRFLSYTKQCPWLVWEEDGRVLVYKRRERGGYNGILLPFLLPKGKGGG